MLEIEQKYRCNNLDALKDQLLQLGATAGEILLENDLYFRAPDRDFAVTDEAFRMRRIGDQNYLTYKGPKRGGTVKKRTELEIPLRDGEESAQQFVELLQHLGYRSSLIVSKKRSQYHWNLSSFPVVICLDEVENLGSFAEVEVLALESNENEAEKVIHQAAEQLGLVQVEPRSYLRMLLEKIGEGRQ